MSADIASDRKRKPGSTAYRMLFRLLVLAAFASLVGAGYFILRPPGEATGLVVEERERLLQGLAPGPIYKLEFRVHNRSGETRRVVGGPCFT